MKKLKKYTIYTTLGRRITISARSIVELRSGIYKLLMR
nr:MAG TPA: alpha-N-acetylgalactosaminidase domain-containing protein [Caudoviricetes sp.]